jgi:serine/threonine-protein kinase RsbW
MTGDRVSYTLDSTLDGVNRAEQAAYDYAAKSGFSEADSDRISMAVREATVNAVLHGNAYDTKKKVRLVFERKTNLLVIKVTDQGRGVDLSRIPDPLAPENLLKQSGRGIFLIRAFMDEVHFRNLKPGTEITLIKHVRGTSANGKED